MHSSISHAMLPRMSLYKNRKAALKIFNCVPESCMLFDLWIIILKKKKKSI